MRILIALSALLLFTGCETADQPEETTQPEIEETVEATHEDTIPAQPTFQDNYYNDVAHFLAGLKGDSVNSKFR